MSASALLASQLGVLNNVYSCLLFRSLVKYSIHVLRRSFSTIYGTAVNSELSTAVSTNRSRA